MHDRDHRLRLLKFLKPRSLPAQQNVFTFLMLLGIRCGEPHSHSVERGRPADRGWGHAQPRPRTATCMGRGLLLERPQEGLYMYPDATGPWAHGPRPIACRCGPETVPPHLLWPNPPGKPQAQALQLTVRNEPCYMLLTVYLEVFSSLCRAVLALPGGA